MESISPHFATLPRGSGLGDEKEEGQKFVRNQIDPSSRQVYVAKLGRMGSSPCSSRISPVSHLHLHYLRRRRGRKEERLRIDRHAPTVLSITGLRERRKRVRRAVEGGGQTVGNSLFINVKAQRHHKGPPFTELASLLSLPIQWGNCKHSDKKNQAPYPAVYPLQGSSHFHVMSSMCRLHFERHKARPFFFLFKRTGNLCFEVCPRKRLGLPTRKPRGRNPGNEI